MIIKNLELVIRDKEAILSVEITSKNLGQKKLWFSSESKYSNYFAKVYDPFLVALLYTAMLHGEDIVIHGNVSIKLFRSIKNIIMPLLVSFSDQLQLIDIFVKDTNKEPRKLEAWGVGTAFSGGVDSFTTIYDHLYLQHDESYKINSFFFVNTGSHGSDLFDAEKKFIKRYKDLARFTSQVGLDFIPINTNVHEFSLVSHEVQHVLTTLSAILSMQAYIRVYYFSSEGANWMDYKTNGYRYASKNISMYMASELVPALSTESMELILDGMKYNRVEKLKKIIEFPPLKEFLNVCVDSNSYSSKNCSKCSKCKRTMLTLKILGVEEDFSQLFDFDLFSRVEKKYLLYVVYMRKKSLFEKYNYNLAIENGYRMPSAITSYVYLNILKIFRIALRIRREFFIKSSGRI